MHTFLVNNKHTSICKKVGDSMFFLVNNHVGMSLGNVMVSCRHVAPGPDKLGASGQWPPGQERINEGGSSLGLEERHLMPCPPHRREC